MLNIPIKMSTISKDIEQLSNCLLQTLSSDINIRKPAEKFIETCETQPGFCKLLLQIIDESGIDSTVKLCASIAFKNFVKKYWSYSDEAISDKINIEDRNYSKSIVINLMLNSDEKVQKQLSESVSLIGQEDFPAKWPNLLESMVVKLNESMAHCNFTIINGVLQTVSSLFKRYQYETKSQELWMEIKFVLDNFAKPLTELFIWIIDLIPKHNNNPQNLKILFNSLYYCSEIFHSLNSQDLAEFFEDNLNVWMRNFLQILQINIKFSENDDEPSIIENLKTQICENITTFAEKYNEEFDPYIPGFISQIWSLLDSLDNTSKYDFLISHAIKFLCIVTNRGLHKEIFEKEQVLQQLCSRVIIPNMEFRESDEEMFEDNPEEYIRRDLEGADVQTRRRAACELVKALAKHFEKPMAEVFGQYIEKMLFDYTQNQKNWKSKNAAIYLVTSLVVKGGSVRLGTTSTSDLINIVNFFNTVIRCELERIDFNETPVLKADALKYMITFRNQLPLNEILIPFFGQIIRHLSSSIIVIHSYAANCIEKILTLREESNRFQPLLKPEIVAQHASTLLENLFCALQMPGSFENEYVIRAILRVFSLLRHDLLPYFDVFLPKVIEKLVQVSKNPSKPNFNHHLFETLSLSIKIACSHKFSFVHSFETMLFPIFQEILIQDVQEFVPYFFQILALIFEYYSPSEQVPIPYIELFPFLLNPLLWERPGNFAPLSRLLQSYIKNCSSHIISTGKIEALLGIFQKLISSKSNDHLGFKIINYLVVFTDSSSLMPFMKQVMFLLFQRLTTSKTTKFVCNLLVFFSLYIYKFGSQVFYNLIESIQSKMFQMVLQRLFLIDSQKISATFDRKIVCVGIVKLLTELQEFHSQQDLNNLWTPLLLILVAIFELPPVCDNENEDHFIEIEQSADYQAAYSRLIFASTKDLDLISEISDPKIYLLQNIESFSKLHPGKLNQLVSTSTELRNYLINLNVKFF